MSIIEILQQIFSATDEQTNAFSEAMKTNGIYTTSHENMDVRYPKLKGDYDALNTKYGDVTKRMGDMEKATQGQGDLQGEIDRLKAALEQEKINSAIKIGLLSEKVADVDYVAFKLNEKLRADGETLSLDDNGNIKGWDKKIEGLKTQFPNQFESSGDNNEGYQVYKPNALHKPDKNEQPITKDTFKSYTYEQRLALKEKNPTLYKQLSGN